MAPQVGLEPTTLRLTVVRLIPLVHSDSEISRFLPFMIIVISPLFPYVSAWFISKVLAKVLNQIARRQSKAVTFDARL